MDYSAVEQDEQFELNERQKKLLMELVRLANEARLGELLIPIPYGPDQYVIYVRGRENLIIERLSDLDALCRAELMDYELNRMGTGKRYRLTKGSFKVVKLWLAGLDEETPLWMVDSAGEIARVVSVPELLEQYHLLRRKVRRDLVKIMPNGLLPEMYDEMMAITRQIEAVEPVPAEVTANIQSLGQKIVASFGHPQQAKEVGMAMASFGAWCRVVYEIVGRAPYG